MAVAVSRAMFERGRTFLDGRVVREDRRPRPRDVAEETDQAEHERQRDRAGGDIGVEPAQQANSENLDEERG